MCAILYMIIFVMMHVILIYDIDILVYPSSANIRGPNPSDYYKTRGVEEDIWCLCPDWQPTFDERPRRTLPNLQACLPSFAPSYYS